MKTLSIFLTSILILIASACSTYDGPPADLVIKNAKVLTIDKENPDAEAIAVIGEKIIAVTSNKNIERYISDDTKIIDAKGESEFNIIEDTERKE